ncbi:hypothetical protein GCM10007937_09070 [Mesorhizobium albiziae]|nr:hypothetical protein GCM10007937_09070 [Mesorhizobium albiziae]
MLKRKRAGGQGVRLPDGEDTGFTVVYGDDNGGQVHFDFVSLDGGSVFPGSRRLILHVPESGWPKLRRGLNRFNLSVAARTSTPRSRVAILALRTCTKICQTRHLRWVTQGKEAWVERSW